MDYNCTANFKRWPFKKIILFQSKAQDHNIPFPLVFQGVMMAFGVPTVTICVKDIVDVSKLMVRALHVRWVFMVRSVINPAPIPVDPKFVTERLAPVEIDAK